MDFPSKKNTTQKQYLEILIYMDGHKKIVLTVSNKYIPRTIELKRRKKKHYSSKPKRTKSVETIGYQPS